jgi:outer membrane protein insertion porin family
MHTGMNIGSVRVEGATHTRKSFLGSLINPCIPPSADTNTLEDVLHTARHISHILHETDIFKSIEARIEASQNALAQKGDVDLVFKALERGRFYLNTSTEVGNGEGNAVRYSPS